MASELLGRCECPECGFGAAHVKIKTDKEGANPYRHCPDCGAQYFPRNKIQADHLRARVRGSTITKPDTPAEKVPNPAPKKEAAIETAPAKKTKIVFGVQVPA